MNKTPSNIDLRADALRELFEEVSLAILNHRIDFHQRDLANPGLKVENEIAVISAMSAELTEIVRQIDLLSGTSLPVIRAKVGVAFFLVAGMSSNVEPYAFTALAHLVRDLNRPYADHVGVRLLNINSAMRQKQQ